MHNDEAIGSGPGMPRFNVGPCHCRHDRVPTRPGHIGTMSVGSPTRVILVRVALCSPSIMYLHLRSSLRAMYHECVFVVVTPTTARRIMTALGAFVRVSLV